MLDNYPDVLSFRQVMEITHVGRNLLLRLLNSGEIPAFKMGKLWKVYKQDLIQYMSQCKALRSAVLSRLSTSYIWLICWVSQSQPLGAGGIRGTIWFVQKSSSLSMRSESTCLSVTILWMPSLGMLTVNALAAADTTLIPVQAQYLSAKGLEQLLQTVQKVRRQINPKLKIEGILLTMTDNRTNYGKQISNLIRQAYGKHLKVFEQTIPRSVRAAETSAAGKSIFAYDPKGKVAEAYKSLAKEVQADADRQRKLSFERAR